MLFHLGYVSTETRRLSRNELLGMVRGAQRHNLGIDVTGLLLHRDDSYFQILEGAREDIDNLYQKISLDDRHQRIELLFEEAIDRREFSNWGMELKDLDDDEIGNIPGVADLISEQHDSGELFRTLPKVRQMLRLFQAIS